MIYETIRVGEYDATLEMYALSNFKILDENRRHPAVVLCPGGGYSYTSSREAEPVAMVLAAMGLSVAVLHYTVHPQGHWPTSLRELAWSVAYIRENADKYMIDKNKIAVMGFSAGGHLAASLACFYSNGRELADFNEDDIKPNALILGYPVILCTQPGQPGSSNAHAGSFKALLGENQNNAELRDYVSLEKAVSNKVPPVFLWSTWTDQAVPIENSLFFAHALAEKNVNAEIHIYNEGRHGESLGKEVTISLNHPANEVVQSWAGLLETWIRKIFEY